MTIEYKVIELGVRGLEDARRRVRVLLTDRDTEEVRVIERNVAGDANVEAFVQNNTLQLWNNATQSERAEREWTRQNTRPEFPYTADVRKMYIMAWRADRNEAGTATRYQNYYELIDTGVSTEWKSIFNAGLRAQSSLSLADLLNVTASTAHKYIEYFETMTARYAPLLFVDD